jgi:diguanylate cyclase (GGDEF)-like protein/PAS domain S-box-containing protein
MVSQTNKFKELRQRAEQILSLQDTNFVNNSFSDIKAIIHELDTYQVELELQNEELQITHKQLQEINQDYLNIYNYAPVSYVTLDEHGNIRNANHTLATLLGVPQKTLLGHSLADFIDYSYQDNFYLQRQLILDQQAANACELMLHAANGKIIWVSCEGFFVQKTKVKEVNLAITDITLLKSFEADLRLGASIFDDSDEGIMIVASDLTILKVNHAYAKLTGYVVADIIGKKTSVLKSGKHDALFYQDMWAAINEYHQWQGEIWNRQKNGDMYPVWLNISARKNSDNEITHYIGIFSNIACRKNAESRIHFMAYYDALTKLPNRTLLQDRIQYAISRSKRNQQFNALMLLDLDHFKVINDSLGHDVGDKLLIEVATRLSSIVREEDTVARLGGDEFIVLLQELHADQQGAEQKASVIADKICKNLEEIISCDGHELHISVSIGIMVFQGDTEIGTDLIKNADNAMYRAKDNGRNKFQLYSTEMKLYADSRLVIETELRFALERGEFELYYQPQIHIESQQICGAEVLLRWNHPINGLISPAVWTGN